MCGLFGFSDYEEAMTPKQRQKLLHVLAEESEVRGTDASGIAYCSNGRVHAYKRPVAGGRLWFRLPRDASAAIGHTRMTTQGSAKHNCNNHPFLGRAGGAFALTHNGMIVNDFQLKAWHCLPATAIETDSYVAVQLIEQSGELSFASLRSMAESVQGMFTFVLLDAARNLWFVKGHNPLVIACFNGFFVYASTLGILSFAFRRCPWLGKPQRVFSPENGDMLKIDHRGRVLTDAFLMQKESYPRWDWYDGWKRGEGYNKAPLDDLLAVANGMGYTVEDIEYLLDEGYDESDIEELLYEPGALGACLAGRPSFAL